MLHRDIPATVRVQDMGDSAFPSGHVQGRANRTDTCAVNLVHARTLSLRRNKPDCVLRLARLARIAVNDWRMRETLDVHTDLN